MPGYDNITDKEKVLLYYSIKYVNEISTNFSISDLSKQYRFLMYAVSPDEIEGECTSLCQKQIWVNKSHATSVIYSLHPDATRGSIEFIDDLTCYIRDSRSEIINRIPLFEFHTLNEIIGRDSGISIFSCLLALGTWKWWKNICEMSSRYTFTLMGSQSVEDFAKYICSAFALKNYSFEFADQMAREWRQKGFAYFNADINSITPWKDIRPAIFLIKADTFSEIQSKIIETIDSLCFRITTAFIIIVLGEPNTITKQAFNTMANTVIIYHEDLKKIALAEFPANSFRDVIKNRIKLPLISPYQVEGYVHPNFFYGRQTETYTILSKANANFAIYGNRRIGKTSLLKKLVSIYTEKENVVYLDCKESAMSEEILCQNLCKSMKLPLCTLSELPNMIKEKGDKFIILLDEIDDLLAYTDGNKIFGLFRALSNEGYLRVIVAGYTTLHKLCMDLKSPLFNFFNPMKLGFLSGEDAMQLALQPMLSLGVNYERGESTVKQLLFFSSYHPNLIQRMCDELIWILDREKRRIIKDDDIQKVYNGEVFQKYVDEIFFANLSGVEQLIILQNLLEKSFDESIIYKKLQKDCPKLKVSQIEEALRNLVLTFVLEKDGKKYKYFYNHFSNIIIKQHTVEYLLSGLISEVNESLV
jgi:hypothetical protein